MKSKDYTLKEIIEMPNLKAYFGLLQEGVVCLMEAGMDYERASCLNNALINYATSLGNIDRIKELTARNVSRLLIEAGVSFEEVEDLVYQVDENKKQILLYAVNVATLIKYTGTDLKTTSALNPIVKEYCFKEFSTLKHLMEASLSFETVTILQEPQLKELFDCHHYKEIATLIKTEKIGLLEIFKLEEKDRLKVYKNSSAVVDCIKSGISFSDTVKFTEDELKSRALELSKLENEGEGIKPPSYKF